MNSFYSFSKCSKYHFEKVEILTFRTIDGVHLKVHLSLDLFFNTVYNKYVTTNINIFKSNQARRKKSRIFKPSNDRFIEEMKMILMKKKSNYQLLFLFSNFMKINWSRH